jgi:ribosomal protein S12 methylthiotransferase accessory factor
MVEHIDMKISLPETFPNKYQDALRKVAEGCMVKKHLATPPKITISTSFHG